MCSLLQKVCNKSGHRHRADRTGKGTAKWRRSERSADRAGSGASLRKDAIGTIDGLVRGLCRVDRRPVDQFGRGAPDRYCAQAWRISRYRNQGRLTFEEGGIGDFAPLSWRLPHREGACARRTHACAPPVGGRSTSRDWRSSRSSRGRRRGHGAPRLRRDIESIRSVPQIQVTALPRARY